MFVKLLVMLISNVLVSFSVLVCCKSLAWKYGLKGEIEQRTNLVSVSALERTCDQARRDKIERACARAQGTRDWVQLRSSARPTIVHTPHQPHIPRCPSRHRFTPCTVGILSGYVRSSTNRYALECIDMWLSAPLTWQYIKICYK